jgi:hypothetical protein
VKYRRIEVNAFRRRVTIVSGVPVDWSDHKSQEQLAQSEDGVTLTDCVDCEPVEPTSPEGQLLLIEAIRSLERRLSPEARAAISGREAQSYQKLFLRSRPLSRLLSPKFLRLLRREKSKPSSRAQSLTDKPRHC